VKRNGKQTDLKTGLARIAEAFANAQKVQCAALMPYYTLGYPSKDVSLAIIEAISANSDLIELGIPFSDPVADGPTIQQSTQLSLENGTTSESCLEMVRELRERGVMTPFLLMGYYNPILAYGEQRFVQDAADAGADGIIVPDLPPEEADSLERHASVYGLAIIHFLAPTSNHRRVRLVVARASGFIYMVSVTGVTGARGSLPNQSTRSLSDVRALTDLPIAVGFGISTPAQATRIGKQADGVIVGSALINEVDKAQNKPELAARAFVEKLQIALQLNKC
jgi:tryptophan synthase alpha chain